MNIFKECFLTYNLMENKEEGLAKIIDASLVVCGSIGSIASLSHGMYLVSAGSGIIAANSAHTLYKRIKDETCSKLDYFLNTAGFGIASIQPAWGLWAHQNATNLLMTLSTTVPLGAYIGNYLDNRDRKKYSYEE
jgi:hypothetical protein